LIPVTGENKKLLPFAFWLGSVLLIVLLGAHLVRKEFEHNTGRNLMALATQLARHTALSPEQVAELSRLEFSELVHHPLNQDFERQARELMALTDIRYIYIETELAPPWRYRVEPGEESLYGAPVGTGLDIQYLLDAQSLPWNSKEGSTPVAEHDKDRYSLLADTNKEVFRRRQPAYLVTRDKWGKFITGYAPFYASDGRFIGMLGVDYDYAAFSRSLHRYEWLLVLLLLSGAGLFLMLRRLVLRSIDAERRAQSSHQSASRDGLTGVFNRKAIWEVLEGLWTQAAARPPETVSLLLVDVDYFKEYNDNYGHLAGDQVLLDIATLLQTVADRHHGWLGRYGGDEFVLLFRGLAPGRERQLAQQLVRQLHERAMEHRFSPIADRQTLSVGAASLSPAEGHGPEVLFELADRALYQAKRRGRNAAFCHA
jgi:diguanylate cyclase (GGDEF)-like protein